MKLEVARAAVIELRAAAKWYEKQREGLGEAFLDAIDRTVAAIVTRPRAFALWRGSRVARSAVVKRFPYVIIFTIRNAETVRVLAFAHTRRAPYWKTRR
jgi:plasmid stabilization system protein ParE